ncbi:hypothetical protein OM2255_00347 [alpha proteobacterium HTCC2255]|jgi:hypothetical protein|nr:hypothetical protein OM2255_00347 [alpha proteobacterium HTCC2255] [Rhodobacterales bacterium HTCC2255]
MYLTKKNNRNMHKKHAYCAINNLEFVKGAQYYAFLSYLKRLFFNQNVIFLLDMYESK